ncbi:MAG: PAP2 superfamily protein [Berkelbacteria bacterium GW2011_GWB1_38_5]|uniref:PAP2 superfamily protein n=2 Tax=Candidatus Berkelbacteria TaxID=1618330 RepID=A0A0G0FXZ0_9BACT|nr:MAG: PAP2 superfamily protein [Berkelbacteria bacterium GW2011_GWA1_36_9]KKQ73873.1 MAG: PAP2 superfamily protein [Berkelbacteria bacterium GW2011_GWB1_38_5]
MIHQINNFDQNIVLSLNSFFTKHSSLVVDKFFAEYLMYFLPVILLILWFWSRDSKKVTLRALFSVILAWPILAYIIGNLINRPRPFEMTGVQELVFHRPDFSFPSDHASALFAVAFSFWFSGYKKLAWVMFVMAIIISFFRVATAIHFPTDILGGFVIGLISAYLIDLFDKPLNIIYSFIIRILKVVHLA